MEVNTSADHTLSTNRHTTRANSLNGQGTDQWSPMMKGETSRLRDGVEWRARREREWEGVRREWEGRGGIAFPYYCVGLYFFLLLFLLVYLLSFYLFPIPPPISLSLSIFVLHEYEILIFILLYVIGDTLVCVCVCIYKFVCVYILQRLLIPCQILPSVLLE